MSTGELVDVIKSLEIEVVAFDVVELNPKYNCNGITAFAITKIIREVLGKIRSGDQT